MRPALILLFTILAALDGPAQQPPSPPQPVLKAETAAVVVDVIVTDRKGHHVPGLSASDFKLYEDNTPQAIASFTSPPARAERPPSRADAAAGTPAPVGPAPTEPARKPELLTLLFDVGDMTADSRLRACAAASKFVKKTVAAGNLIAIYWVDSRLQLGTPFTRDQEKALDVIDRIGRRQAAGFSTAQERESVEREMRESPMIAKMLRSWLTTANALQARTVFVALRAMAFAYRDLPGRKNVVVFSEGFRHARDGGSEMKAVIDAANRANVAIYVIDAAGLTLSNFSAVDKIPDSGCGAPDSSGIGMGAAMGEIDEFDWLQSFFCDLHSDLGAIAAATGGFLVKDNNDLGAALDHIEDDASEFYTLVYSPSNRNYDGGFRKIKVELAGRGYHVRYRRGYWALPPGREVIMTPAAAQLLAAIETGERKPSFAPQLNAVLVPSPDGGFGVSTAVSMPGKLVRFEKFKNQYVAGVTVLLIARDANAQILAVHERYGDISLNPKEHAAFPTKVFNWQGHVGVPGFQPVSVQAIVRLAGGAIGVSQRKNIEPAPASANLRLTSLVLSDRAENSPCEPSPTEPLCVKGGRIFLPAGPQFVRSTKLVVYFGVLGASLSAAQKPDLGLSFGLRSGTTLQPFLAKDLTAFPGEIPGSYMVLADFDLETIPAGSYQLEMTAEDRIQRARATERAELTVDWNKP